MKKPRSFVLALLFMMATIYVWRSAAQAPAQQKPEPAGPAVDLGPEVPLPYTTEFADADSLKVWKVHDELDVDNQAMPSQWEVTGAHALTQRLWGNLTLNRTDSGDTFAHTDITVGSRTWKDYEVEVTVRRPYESNDYTTFGVIVGYQVPEKHYRFTVDNRYAGQGPTMRLERREKDRVVLLAIYRAGIPHDVSVKVRVAFAHKRLAVWVADIPIINVAENAILSGKAGLFTAMPGGRAGVPSIEFSQFSARPVASAAAVAPAPTNVLSAAADASAIGYSATEDQGPFTLIDEQLLPEKNDAGEYNHPWGMYSWEASQENLPFEIVFRFPRGEWAQLQNISFVKKSTYENPFVRDVEVWISRTSPLEGFLKVKKLTLKPVEGEETFPLGGVWARYLKVMFLSAQEAGNKVALGEVRAKGVLSAAGPPEIAAAAVDRPDLEESESNDTIQTANKLPLGKILAGKLGSEADTDVFRLTLPAGAAGTLHLTFDAPTPGAPEVAIVNSRGEVIETIGAATLYLRPSELSRRLPAGDYFIKLTWPAASLVMLYDDSDSMSYSLEETRKAWQQMLTSIDGLAGKVAVMLLRYNDQPELLTDFLTDSGALKAVLSENIGRGGSTQTHLGIDAALNALRGRPGNRIILWLMDQFDYKEQGERHFQGFFRRIHTEGAHAYILGVSQNWAQHEQVMGLTQGARAAEIAGASGGEFIFAPSDEKIGPILDRILRDLTSSIRYNLRAELKKTGGLQVVSSRPAGKKLQKNIEIILDASGSMKTLLGKTTRWATALNVLRQVLAKLPDEFSVGLRIYGHRESSRSPNTCTDSELVVPIGKLDRDSIMAAANSVKPKGETPLVYSALQTPEDLKAVGGGSVIMITDGEESCKGDPLAAAQQLKESGVDVTLNIVGFTLTGQQVQKQLAMMAEATGGRFYSAQSGEALARAILMAAVEKFPYAIFDASGKEVADGEADGPPEELPAGTYRVVVTVAGQELVAHNIRVDAGAEIVLRVVFKGSQFVLER